MAFKSLEEHQLEEIREKQRLLQQAEVGLWLYNYDDIFSDFDPRPYSQRALSEDFLTEAKKISRQKESGQLHLRVSVPEKARDLEKEKAIKKRLHDHFKRHAEILRNETKGHLKKGTTFAGLGLVFMFSAAIIKTWLHSGLLFNMLIVLLEPSGWFMAWYGFDKIIDIFRSNKPDADFYSKMASSDIEFLSY